MKSSPAFRRLGSAALALLLAASAVAQTPTFLGPPAPFVDGKVNAIAVDGNTAYLGGKFTRVGEFTGAIQVFDATTRQRQSGWPIVTGQVNAAISDGAGGYYIGGQFSSVGGLRRVNLAHIRADKTVNPDFNADMATECDDFYTYVGGIGRFASKTRLSAYVNCLLLEDHPTRGKVLYVGGRFRHLNGYVERNSLAGLNAATGAVTAWNPYVSFAGTIEINGTQEQFDHPGTVHALAKVGETLYFGGEFLSVQLPNPFPPASVRQGRYRGEGAVARRNLAAVSLETGLATSWNATVATDTFIVRSMGVYAGSELVVGGGNGSNAGVAFIGGQARPSGLAKIDLNTGELAAWSPAYFNRCSLPAAVAAVAVSGNTLYVASNEICFDAGPYYAVSLINAVISTTWVPQRQGSFGEESFLQLQGSEVVLGNRGLKGVSFVSPANGTASATQPDTAFSTNTLQFTDSDGGSVMPAIRAIAFSGNTFLVGGNYVAYTTQSANNVAAIEVSTGKPLTWAGSIEFAGVAPEVFALAKIGTSVFAGGLFDRVNGATAKNLAAFNATTGARVTWPATTDAPVRALVSLNNVLYAGGDFVNVNTNVERVGLAAFDPSTGAATAWNPAPNNLVRTLVTDGTSFFAGGNFTTVNNGAATRRGLAAFDSAGNVLAFDPNIGVSSSRTVHALAVDATNIYAGGSFFGANSVNGSLTRNYAAGFNKTTGAATAFDPNLSDVVNAIAVQSGIVYLGGAFTSLEGGPVTRRGVAATLASDGRATTFLPASRLEFLRDPNTVNAFLPLPGRLWVASKPTSIKTSTQDGSYPHGADLNYTRFSLNSGLNAVALSTSDVVTQPNILNAPGKLTLVLGDPFTFQLNAPGATAYEISDLGAGMTFDRTTGVLSGTPITRGFGNLSIQVGFSLDNLKTVFRASNAGGVRENQIVIAMVTPTPGPTMAPTPTPTRTPTPGPTATPTRTPTPGPTATPTPTPTPTVTPTPTPTGPPAVVAQPANHTVPAGGTANFSATPFGFGFFTFQWFFNGQPIGVGRPAPGSTAAYSGVTSANLKISGVSAADAGSYFCRIGNGSGQTTDTQPAALVIGQLPPRLINVATRLRVGVGDDVLIGGFVIQGSGTKRTIVRAIGPSLTAFGVAGALANPTLELRDASGALVASNDDWRANQVAVQATGLAPNNDLESALVLDLAAGAYTAIVRGVNEGQGVALVEVYDLQPGATDIRPINLSTRGKVQTGDNVMIGGFVINGVANRKLVIRSLGPSLTAFGVAGALGNPIIEVKNAGGVTVASNDDWQAQTAPGSSAAELTSLQLAPPNPLDSAVVLTLVPGAYTVIVRGVGDTSGVAIVEAYEVQ